MVIALLAVLGVDLIVLVAVLVFVLSRKRWVTQQEGSFHGAIRVTGGAVEGLRSKWTRGYGRWVRDVLVWTKAPFLFRNELVAIDALHDPRATAPGEVKRVGANPIVVVMMAGDATVEIAAASDTSKAVAGPICSNTNTGAA
ncbi:DUF2550 family protein [Cryobacterium sp. N22]|uniref:DUF2550 family protein n=1 Tax=Cryobacterium sp. N22 TaxID=2048290 RepID=UPI000CE4BA9E|nr:DUF2550 family protein [Cryobacterium sp. N22]